MKKLLLFILLSIIGLLVKAQDKTDISSTNTDTTIFATTDVEVAPECSGGFERFSNYVASNKQMQSLHDKGFVYVQFVVETDGKLSQIKVVRGLSADANKVAVTVIHNSPIWKPGIKAGHPVRVRCTLPLKFNGA